MADEDTQVAIQRLRESRPPATDTFTYLTIVEKSLSPEVLPALQEILEDADLTVDIGWDLVAMLAGMPGSEACLEVIARLGNPREVILKVLESMEQQSVDEGDTDDEDDDDDDDEEEELEYKGKGKGKGKEEDSEAEGAAADGNPRWKRFVRLTNMLGVLHRRLSVKSPSRFLHTSLATLARAYDARDPESTAAVIRLVRDLSGVKRPPLPTRKSSTAKPGSKFPTMTSSAPGQDGGKDDAAGPDPEAEEGTKEAEGEAEVKVVLLRSFMTCVMDRFVNGNEMEWAARMVEKYAPGRVVPGRKTMLERFGEEEELQQRDVLAGEIVALLRDLGLSKPDDDAWGKLGEVRTVDSPLDWEPDMSAGPTFGISLSTVGYWALVAYWIFTSEVFGAQHQKPDMHMFPEHSNMLAVFSQKPQAIIARNPGVAESLLVMGLWLAHANRIRGAGAEGAFMEYHHQITLIAVFHPAISVRNAAVTYAGQVLRSDPDPRDRLRILADLLENCIFVRLQACAVGWIKDEMLGALAGMDKDKDKDKDGAEDEGSPFGTTEGLESVQYSLFPDLSIVKHMSDDELADWWVESGPFLLQVANFSMVLFSPELDLARVVPEGMPAAVEERFVKPVHEAARRLKAAAVGGGGVADEAGFEVVMDRLERLSL